MSDLFTIPKFTGEYAFLSNFYTLYEPIVLGADLFPSLLLTPGHEFRFKTIEHAYQALKATRIEDVFRIQNASTPGEAKSLGGRIRLRSGWDNMRIPMMNKLLLLKVEDPVLKSLLLDTGDAELVEGNFWHDCYWGVCDGSRRVKKCLGHPPVGENYLGKLWMEIRKDLL